MSSLLRHARAAARWLMDAQRAGRESVDRRPARGRGSRQQAPSPQQGTVYPGDFHGQPTMSYAPVDDDNPDPGEIVWTWVPYEEDHSRGKDRPVLVIARDGQWFLGLPLTSKDHDRDAAQEAEAGRTWVDIGSGGWDRRGRESEVRTNRVVRIAPAQVRRGGGRISAEVYARVAEAVRRDNR